MRGKRQQVHRADHGRHERTARPEKGETVDGLMLIERRFLVSDVIRVLVLRPGG